ncbi:nucleotide exchange factor GrpE [Salipaludibacillus neizhouensis]|uniref:Protein GrpE n=1 Tax=Salipaludibacillus neizhouensis TaxID=885475 RepID=A0A3A9KDU1_9BACI|nr:nucleotide exchange factor GrpE [Salipaludibacillus neizhouensis]RKL68661.1 nucleotide exchange factor GrpE [Salipaludibacillus neizhouensis]
MENEERKEVYDDQDTKGSTEDEVIEPVHAELVDDEEGQEDTDEEETSDELNQLNEKLEETNNRLLRTQADFDNFRRRMNKEKESAAKYKSQSLAESLLPAMDNFERALQVDAQSEDTKGLLQGMEMVYRQLKEALEKEGIVPIETVGQPFDPHFHQAVMQVESEEFESNIVVEELQPGYKLKDRIIRPAMVKVNA